MTCRHPLYRFIILAACSFAAAMAACTHQALRAAVLRDGGEPDPAAPELRLWLRADSGILDADGRTPADPDFSGKVAAWKDRSPNKFDLGAATERAPLFVPRQPAAGEQPAVSFVGNQILTRAQASLYDRPGSTVVLVLQSRPNPHGSLVYHVGGAQNLQEILSIGHTNDPEPALASISWTFPTSAGARGLGLATNLPGDGRWGGRFFVLMLRNGERVSAEFHDAMGDVFGPPREVAPPDVRGEMNKCSPNFVLGGEAAPEFLGSFSGQIAEMIVYNHDLTSAERSELLSYLYRRYQLNVAAALFPPDTYLLQAEDFDGGWQIANNPLCQGGRCVTAEGAAASEGIKTTIHLSSSGAYYVWLRANEGGFNGTAANGSALKTTIQGQDLRVTHVRGPGGFAWREVGIVDEVELKAGPAEIVIRGEGTGNKSCDALLISKKAPTLDKLEEICVSAQRLRRLGGESRLTALFDNGLRLDGSLTTLWRWTDAAGQSAHSAPANMPSLVCLQFDSPVDKPASEAEAIVELHNGDRLRGLIADYVPATPQGESARLLVRPLAGFFEKREFSFSVDVDWIRRIIFESSPRDRRCPPQTLICRNGRTFSFKAIRWGEQSVSLLTDDGIERLALTEIAELRMPTVDAWDNYYRELSILDPELKAGIIRIETLDGMILTTSTARSSYVSAPTEPVARMRMIQPAWCYWPIPIFAANTRLLWQSPAQVVPLSRFLPAQVVQRGILGSSWMWRSDRNVIGSPLRSGGLQYLWGFGVHAPCEMVFQLPACARSLRTHIGIDSSVGSAGSAVAKIYANQASGTPLYESKPLVGSVPAAFTGDIVLPPAASGKGRTLVLAARSAGELRAEKGEPLDIGSHVDWLEGVLLLDPAELRAEVEKRRPTAAK